MKCFLKKGNKRKGSCEYIKKLWYAFSVQMEKQDRFSHEVSKGRSIKTAERHDGCKQENKGGLSGDKNC